MKYICEVHGVVDERPCLQCKPEKERLKRERRKRQGTERVSGRQLQRQRRSILAAFDNHCAAIVDGKRCTEVLALEVHHVDGDRTNDAPSNRVPLCHEHHLSLAHAPRSAFAQGSYSGLMPRIG